MKNITIMLFLLGVISPSVWGNDTFKRSFEHKYNLYSNDLNNFSNLYNQYCTNEKTTFSINKSSSIISRNDCFIDSYETKIMFQYRIPEKDNKFALSYNNTFSIGLSFETKKYDTGNGEITVKKPKIDAGFHGKFSSWIFDSWKISLNSTTMKKLQAKNLPHDPFMREIMQNLDGLYTHNNGTLSERMIHLEGVLYFW
jgi:hypothetical protein